MQRTFPVDRELRLCFPEAAYRRRAAFCAQLWITCLGLATILPVSLHSQNSQALVAAPAAHSADADYAHKMYRAGVALAEQGKLDEAIATFEKALDTDRHCPLLDAAGAAYSFKGDFPRAQQYFLECLAADPGFVPARKNLAITYFTLGQYDLATAEFQKLKGISLASRPVADLFLGMIAEKNANYLEAVKLLELSGALLQRYPEAILSFAEAEFQLKHLHRTQAVLNNFDTAHGITAPQYVEAADLHSRLGQNSKALAELDKAAVQDDRLERVAYERAFVLDQMDRSAEALPILKDLAANNPSSDTLNLLAHVAEKNGDFALTMQSLRQAAKLDPTREDNYLDFSTICADYGNYPLALEAATIGLGHIPNSYRLMVQKGVVLENLGRLDEAEENLRNAAQLQKDNDVALLSLAIVQTHAGQLQDAEATLTSALQRFPDNYYMHYHLGKILVQLQENNPADASLTVKARHAFQEAIRSNPSYADSYYQLSKLYLREFPKLAEQNLVTCLRKDPHHAPAEYTLARLYLSTGRRAAGQALVDRFERQQQDDKRKESQKPRIESAQN
ncbi:MAG: tetratricopeptide repeat protein [Candidatus Sulfotelmatobacter sp.]